MALSNRLQYAFSIENDRCISSFIHYTLSGGPLAEPPISLRSAVDQVELAEPVINIVLWGLVELSQLLIHWILGPVCVIFVNFGVKTITVSSVNKHRCYQLF